jgi:peptide chain release factor 3
LKYTNEINKRKTFAIISHPDAGKTTLTEKFLLFGGAIQTAGAVKSNKIKKHATSDFMEIERQRGISVATSVMSFEYKGMLINLLDTPGHKDFAEDTYRTLTAVDSVILVIDSVNGVEAQTRRLMEVCRMRDTPVIVFINKMDRDGKNRFDLLEEIEKELNLSNCTPWPGRSTAARISKGSTTCTIRTWSCFTANTKATDEDTVEIDRLDSSLLDERLGEKDAAMLREDVELVDGVHGQLDVEDYLAGKVAPVFFGSAINNFGVREMLDTLSGSHPGPGAARPLSGCWMWTRINSAGLSLRSTPTWTPNTATGSPFLRVCSGRFERNKYFHHVRLDKDVRFSNPYTFLARDKDVIEEAYPGRCRRAFRYRQLQDRRYPDRRGRVLFYRHSFLFA